MSERNDEQGVGPYAALGIAIGDVKRLATALVQDGIGTVPVAPEAPALRRGTVRLVQLYVCLVALGAAVYEYFGISALNKGAVARILVAEFEKVYGNFGVFVEFGKFSRAAFSRLRIISGGIVVNFEFVGRYVLGKSCFRKVERRYDAADQADYKGTVVQSRQGTRYRKR